MKFLAFVFALIIIALAGGASVTHLYKGQKNVGKTHT